MTGWGQTRSFGDVGSMSGLPESGHGWAIHEYRPLIRPSCLPFARREQHGGALLAERLADFWATLAELRITMAADKRQPLELPRGGLGGSLKLRGAVIDTRPLTCRRSCA